MIFKLFYKIWVRNMAFSTTGLATTQAIFVFRHGKHLCTKYFRYSCMLVNETICEDLMKITQIIVEIWAHLFLWISLKIAKLRYNHYYYFCTVEDVALYYHHTKFGNNCKTQGWNMDKSLIRMPKIGPPVIYSLRMGLHDKIN